MLTLLLIGLTFLIIIGLILAIALASPIALILMILMLIDAVTISVLFRRRR